jgi:cyanophycinase
VKEHGSGRLIIIGGHEEKKPGTRRAILSEVCGRARESKGSLLIISTASSQPDESAKDYVEVFRDLGARDIHVLGLHTRADGHDPAVVQRIAQASVVFFTGGDQLRLTSQIADSPAFRCLVEIYRKGATLAGTSAGAAAMSETMIIGGPGDQSNRISALGMAPGLGLIHNVVIDTHFAQRGRFGRLLGAIAENPKNLGVGIDENTALVAERDDLFRVLGTGAVYVYDGTDISYSSLSDSHPEGVVSIFGIKLHVLSEGDGFDLAKRRPIAEGETEKEIADAASAE